ncbi:MAG: hydantoinase/oxoprolinase N-terminal domain-containing protein, partial [Gaiella sp.]
MRGRIGVDVGGTFTDVLLHTADGKVQARKLLSTPPSYDRAVVEAVAGLTRASEAAVVDEVVHG